MKSHNFPRLIVLILFSLLPMVLAGCGSTPSGLPTYGTLTVTMEGSGTVTPGTSRVLIGKQLSLQAVPKTGWKFDHWEGPVTGSTNPATVTVSSDATLIAVFVDTSTHPAPEVYNLMVTTKINTPASFKLEGYSPEGYTLSYTLGTPTHGYVSGGASGVTYIPKSGFTGPDSFTYKAKDSYNESSEATVIVEVVTEVSVGWAKTFGSADVDRIYAMAIDAAGGIYITGNFSDIVDFDPGVKSSLYASAGSTDAFLAKYSMSGEFQWVKTIGGAENDSGTALATDSSNNVYIVGTFSGTIAIDAETGTNMSSPNGTGAFVCQFTSEGKFGWAKPIVGEGTAAGYAIDTDTSGNVFVGGSFTGRIDFNGVDATDKVTAYGLSDGFVTKLTTAGVYVWTDIIGGSAVDELTALAVDTNGNIFAAGYFGSVLDLDPGDALDNVSGLGISDAFLLKLNTTGQKIWAKAIGGAGKEQALVVAVNDLGEVAMGGLFEKSFNFNTSSGSDVKTSAGETDGFVTLYSSDGLYQWTRIFGGTGSDQVSALAFDTSGNLYVAGGFTGQVNFRRGFGGADTITSAGLMDAFVTRITDTGEYGATATVGGEGDDIANAVMFNPLDLNLFWGGSFQDTANLDPRWEHLNKTEYHSAFGNDDCFLIRTTTDFDW